MMTIEQITEKLKATLKPNRFEHSISVAHTAVHLAKIYGADADKAYLAGLLHDCAKNMSSKEHLEYIEKHSILLSDDELKSPGLLHSFVGAYLAREVYGVDDAEIFDAIYYHTIGKKEMPVLTKIIYLADGIEPLRSYPGADDIRAMADKDIDRAVVMYTDTTMIYVISKWEYMHPSAVETRNYYIRKISDSK